MATVPCASLGYNPRRSPTPPAGSESASPSRRPNLTAARRPGELWRSVVRPFPGWCPILSEDRGFKCRPQAAELPEKWNSDLPGCPSNTNLNHRLEITTTGAQRAARLTCSSPRSTECVCLRGPPPPTAKRRRRRGKHESVLTQNYQKTQSRKQGLGTKLR